MSNWNKAQETAIKHKDGPMMVLAGPGAGKTLVITERTKYLIETYGVSPSNILVITFTRAASKEMKERFQKLVGKTLPVSFGTFHSVFFTILKYAYHFQVGNILPENKKFDFIKEILIDQAIEIEDEADFLRSIVSEISLVKGQMIPLEHYYSSSCSEEVFQIIYEEYNKKLRLNKWIDFDDILVYTYELLRERKDILRMWQQKFRYILIDEFQDINQIQYEIVKMLAGEQKNLFIVGDDDQSIYRFRGAKPEIMLGFPKDYENVKEVLLDVNYRSSKQIIEAAGKVIHENHHRFDKKIESFIGDGPTVDVRIFKNQRDENQWIVRKIMDEYKKGVSYDQMAVLFRTNLSARQLLGKLMEFNIPFYVKDGIPSLFRHWIARDLMDYMKLALGDRRRSTFLRIMNRPKRYISREYLPEAQVSFEDLKDRTKDKPWLFDYIEELEEDIRLLSSMTPSIGITYIEKSIGYKAYLTEYARFRKMKVEELTDVLDELKESAKPFETYEEWFEFIREYEEKLKEQQREKDEIKDGVVLSTFHSSKGLEYERVFLIDVNEEFVPHKKAVKDEDIEEERRMFYVGMTRAKRYLHIFSVEKMYNKEKKQSRFLDPLLREKQSRKEQLNERKRNTKTR